MDWQELQPPQRPETVCFRLSIGAVNQVVQRRYILWVTPAAMKTFGFEPGQRFRVYTRAGRELLLEPGDGLGGFIATRSNKGLRLVLGFASLKDEKREAQECVHAVLSDGVQIRIQAPQWADFSRMTRTWTKGEGQPALVHDHVKETRSKPPPPNSPQVSGYAQWTDAEDLVIRQHFPGGGVAPCEARLPGRTLAAITTRASKLKIVRRPIEPLPSDTTSAIMGDPAPGRSALDQKGQPKV